MKLKNGRKAAVVGGVALLLVVVGAAAMPLASGASVDMSANKDLNARFLTLDGAKDLAYTITSDKLDDVKLTFDGAPVEGVKEGNALVFRPTNLGEGKHTFTASSKGKLPGQSSSESHSFEIDSTAPVVAIDKVENVKADAPFTLTGTIEGAQLVKIDGLEVALTNGRFSVPFEKAPSSVKVWAQDAAGNIAEQTVAISGPGGGAAVRSAHITAFGWATASLREPLLQLIKDKKLDNVQLDIKDEDGIIGYLSEVPLAKQANLSLDRYNVKEALDTIHGLGATVTGRIVAFRDPRLGAWAVKNGRLDLLIQNTSGGPYTTKSYGTGAFTNFANPEIIEYNTALGEEATKLGFDDIMYDYVRKPENLGQVYKGIGDRTVEQAIVDFVKIAGARIHASGGKIGAAVYGIAAFSPSLVAQNIPDMAEHLDYLAPMVYPSHWNSGEYDVANPNAQPYDIIKRSLMDFNRLVLAKNPKCLIIPWLQAFTLGAPAYTSHHVAEQIRASKDVGVNGFYLWNAGSQYTDRTSSILEVRGPEGNVPGKVLYSVNKPGNISEGSTDAAAAKTFIDAYIVWKNGGKQGLFVNPLLPASGTGTTTPQAPVSGQAPAAPATPPPTGAPSAAPSASASARP
ncbi:MAG: putative glycoside hydrolase [Sporichthyaceae bacterium]